MTDYLEVYRTFREESMISPGQRSKCLLALYVAWNDMTKCV